MGVVQSVLAYEAASRACANHPSVDAKSCLNARQSRFSCSKCVNACTEGVYLRTEGRGLPRADWTKCLNCGACVSSCPARAINPSLSNLKQVRRCLDDDRASLSVSCHQGGPADLQVRCLAAVPWELLATFALRADLEIRTGACAGCSDALEGAARRCLSETRRFLGEEYFERHVSVVTSRRGLTRRESVCFAYGSGRAVADDLAPLDPSLEPRASLFRETLSREIRRRFESDAPDESPAPQMRWSVPARGDRCWGCGICRGICPKKAISFHDLDPDHVAIDVDPLKCTRCGLCMKACPESAIGPWEDFVPNAPDDRYETVIDVHRCSRCGSIYKEEDGSGLCPTCACNPSKWARWM